MRRAAALAYSLMFMIGCGPVSSQIQTYNLGDRVQTGPLNYEAFETHWYPSLGPPSNPRVPANRFLVIRISIANRGATDSTVPSMTLVDDSGQSFNELADGSGIPDWLGIVRKIKPVDAEKGVIAFDVAPKHYKLRVSDESDQIVSYIDLPLTLIPDEKSQ